MKKVLIFTVLVLMLFAVSCSGTQPAEEIVPEFDTDYEVDLSGMTFRFGSSWNTQLNPSEGFSAAGDKMNARYRAVKDKFGAEFLVVEWEDGGSKILSNIAAGMQTVDLLDSHSCNGGWTLYKAGVLAALDEIPTIDLSDDKWGTEAFRQYGYFDGKSYGFYQFKWEYMPEFAGVLLFNADVLSHLGQEYPYELQEAGLWNWENYRNLLQACADNADPGDGIVPMTTVTLWQDAEALMFANGCQMVTQDSNGKYQFALDTNAIAAVEYLRDLYNAKLYQTRGMDLFTDSKAVFVGCESFFGTHHHDGYTYPTNILENFGMMPMPYGPNGNPNLSSGFVHKQRRMNWIIAYSGNEVDDIGRVLDFVFEPLDEESEGWRSYSESIIFHHYQDYDNYCFMLDNINYNYSVQVGTFQDDFCTDIVLGRKSGSEVLDSIREKAQAQIDQFMNAEN